jgi:hypothetical protein
MNDVRYWHKADIVIAGRQCLLSDNSGHCWILGRGRYVCL